LAAQPISPSFVWGEAHGFVDRRYDVLRAVPDPDEAIPVSGADAHDLPELPHDDDHRHAEEESLQRRLGEEVRDEAQP
jgi:hypothetical protein